jgi:C-terminal processing protease CtpA/Prc
MLTGMIRFLMFVLFACLSMGLVEAAQAHEIGKLLGLLADPAFNVRQQAATELRDLGSKQREKVQMALLKAYRDSDDPEVRFRSREILTDLLVSSLGYIGISFAKREHINSQGEKRWAILINDVQNDSPASKAELRAGDVILRLNGKELGADADVDFPKTIKSTGSGTVVALTIERDGEEKRVPVTLGTWPRPVSPSEADALFMSKIRALEPAAAP